MNGRIKKYREFSGFTQKEFAKKIGIAFRSLQNYESTSRKIPSEVIKTLYTQFGVDPIWLLTGEGEMFGNPGEGDQTERIGAPEPVDEVELILQLNETASEWIEEGLVKPQAKKAIVRKLYDLMKGKKDTSAGKGERQGYSNIKVTDSDGVLNIGNHNKITGNRSRSMGNNKITKK